MTEETKQPATNTPRPRALTIAGSDSGGGAGIQADLKTFSALGAYGMSAITAVTVQNTLGVSGYHEVPAQVVADQIRAVVTDIGVDAAKTGMLASVAIIEAVATTLTEVRVPQLVVDPVFISKHGDPLLQADAVEAIRRKIFPLAMLVTPNLHEASGLIGAEIVDRAGMQEAGRRLLDFGCQAVLVKGGHLAEAMAPDLYYDGGEMVWLESERIDTPDTHGTGCTLSAAITAYLAAGIELWAAVEAGKRFVTEAIRGGLSLGEGIGPVDQLWGIEVTRGE